MTFERLAQYFQVLEQTNSRLAMTEQLAEVFSQAQIGEIGKICYLLQGRVVPLYDAIEFGIADKFMIRAVVSAYAVDEKQVLAEFRKHGDLGTAAEVLSRQNSQNKKTPHVTVADVFQKLSDIARLSGEGSQDRKVGLLSDLLRQVDPLSVRYIVRIPLDKLRLGFSDMTILDALSWMITGDKSLRDQFEAAYSVLPDIGLIAEAVKAKGQNGVMHVHAKIGAPILASLCQRLPSADEMIQKMGTVAVEPKYDGVRVQIHYRRKGFLSPQDCIRTYSRNLENTTGMFPELQQISIQVQADDVILDSEAVGIDPKTDKIVSFQATTTRKRKHNIAAMQESVPLKFFVFDILYQDGQDLLSIPLSRRRKVLATVVKPGKILEISPHIVTDSADTIRSYHEQQIQAGLEGVVIKKWESPYEPGRRGYSWVKFKEEEGKTGKLTDTIDAVVMGYYRGEGKRSSFGIGAFLVGVRSGDTFVSVTKVGTGVSDALWKQLLTEFNTHKANQRPKVYPEITTQLEPDVWLNPALVVEIAGDDLTVSPSHGAGYAVRFPRLVRERKDKNPEQATTVEELTVMYQNQLGSTIRS